jgi:hypothetical protein
LPAGCRRYTDAADHQEANPDHQRNQQQRQQHFQRDGEYIFEPLAKWNVCAQLARSRLGSQ